MQLTTYGTAKAKVELDLDIQGDTVIDEDEMLSLFNSAVDDCEAIIHQLHEDYFLTSDYVALVDGTSDYDMPDNIYANKIRKVYYKSGTTKYEVTKIKIMGIPLVDDEDEYMYNIENNTGAAGTRFIVYPESRETDSTVMRRWFVRNATILTSDASVIDIPEFINYIYAHVKFWISVKIGHPRMVVYKSEMDAQDVSLRNTLNSMIEDSNTTIEPDLSFYEDFDSDF